VLKNFQELPYMLEMGPPIQIKREKDLVQKVQTIKKTIVLKIISQKNVYFLFKDA
jgi:hypothetical protein